jgi:hypothetical protein
MKALDKRGDAMKDEISRANLTPLDQLFVDMTMQQKWLLMGHIYSEVRRVHADYFRWRNPDATDEDIVNDWMAFTLEPEHYKEVQEFMARQKSTEGRHSQSETPR